jgi:hypothetical protein
MGEPCTTKLTNWSYWIQEEFPTTTVDSNNNLVAVTINHTEDFFENFNHFTLTGKLDNELQKSPDLESPIEDKIMVKSSARGGGEQLIQRRPRRKAKTQPK